MITIFIFWLGKYFQIIIVFTKLNYTYLACLYKHYFAVINFPMLLKNESKYIFLKKNVSWKMNELVYVYTFF